VVVEAVGEEEQQTCSADGTCSEEEKENNNNDDVQLTETDNSGCSDSHEQCEFWGSVGECDK